MMTPVPLRSYGASDTSLDEGHGQGEEHRVNNVSQQDRDEYSPELEHIGWLERWCCGRVPGEIRPVSVARASVRRGHHILGYSDVMEPNTITASGAGKVQCASVRGPARPAREQPHGRRRDPPGGQGCRAGGTPRRCSTLPAPDTRKPGCAGYGSVPGPACAANLRLWAWGCVPITLTEDTAVRSGRAAGRGGGVGERPHDRFHYP